MLSIAILVPFCICLMTGMTEALSGCHPLRPGFGEGETGERCFFTSPMAEIFWYHIPIIIYLLVNVVIFFVVSLKVYRDDSQEIENPFQRKLRDENMQQ